MVITGSSPGTLLLSVYVPPAIDTIGSHSLQRHHFTGDTQLYVGIQAARTTTSERITRACQPFAIYFCRMECT